MSQKNLEEINKLSKKIRKKILNLSLNAKDNSSHFGGSLSTVEIISTLYYKYMSIKASNLLEDRNRFILSKGHACLAYYAGLLEKGFFSQEELNTFEEDGSNFLGHPVMNKNLGILFNDCRAHFE